MAILAMTIHGLEARATIVHTDLQFLPEKRKKELYGDRRRNDSTGHGCVSRESHRSCGAHRWQRPADAATAKTTDTGSGEAVAQTNSPLCISGCRFAKKKFIL